MTRHAARAGGLGIAVLLGLSMLELPIVPLVYTLDSSGHAALAFLYLHPRLAGVEWAYTYGPLGGFFWPIYDPDLYWQQLVWEVVVKLATAVLLVRMGPSAQAPGWQRAGYLALLLVVVPLSPLDAQYWLAIVATTVLLIRGATPRGWLAGGLLLLAAIAMVKFTFLVFASVGALAIGLALWLRGARLGAAASLAGYAAALLAIWLFCGQSLANVAPYLRTSLELASGHSQALSMGGPVAPVALALVLLALALPAAIASVLLGESRRIDALVGAFACVALFLAWKASFVRQDVVHEMQFFPLAAVLAFAVFDRPPARRRARAGWLAVRALWLALALGGFASVLWTSGLEVDAFPPPLVAGRAGEPPASGLAKLGRKLERNLVDLSLPEAARRRRDAERAEVRRRFDLPQIRDAAAGRTIDFMSQRLGEALLNDLNWSPRPVFLSAMTYAPALLDLNARHLAGPQAPSFVALTLGSIDGRYPTLDDGPALWELLRRYRPFLAEKGYLLLERSPAPGPDRETLLWQREVAFGEEVALPALREGTGQRLFVDIRPSTRGRLAETAYRFPPIAMETTHSDGRRLRFRIVPAMSGSGFVINPSLLETRDVAAWLMGATPPRTLSLRIALLEPDHAGLVQPRIGVTLMEGELAIRWADGDGTPGRPPVEGPGRAAEPPSPAQE